MLRTFHVVTFRGSYLPKDTHICILISFSEIHGTHCNMYSFHVSNNFFFFLDLKAKRQQVYFLLPNSQRHPSVYPAAGCM